MLLIKVFMQSIAFISYKIICNSTMTNQQLFQHFSYVSCKRKEMTISHPVNTKANLAIMYKKEEKRRVVSIFWNEQFYKILCWKCICTEFSGKNWIQLPLHHNHLSWWVLKIVKVFANSKHKHKGGQFKTSMYIFVKWIKSAWMKKHKTQTNDKTMEILKGNKLQKQSS